MAERSHSELLVDHEADDDDDTAVQTQVQKLLTIVYILISVQTETDGRTCIHGKKNKNRP